MSKINLTVYGSHDLSDSTSMNYNMVMDDACSDSTSGKGGKHKKYKVGLNGKAGKDVAVNEAGDDELQKVQQEQQSISDAAEEAKQQSESDFKAEQEKRKLAAQEKAEQRAERMKKHAEQKARDQTNGTPQ